MLTSRQTRVGVYPITTEDKLSTKKVYRNEQLQRRGSKIHWISDNKVDAYRSYVDLQAPEVLAKQDGPWSRSSPTNDGYNSRRPQPHQLESFVYNNPKIPVLSSHN